MKKNNKITREITIQVIEENVNGDINREMKVNMKEMTLTDALGIMDIIKTRMVLENISDTPTLNYVG